MKQNKFLSMFFVLALLFVSCEEEDDLNLNDTNHRIIVTSEMNFENKVIVGGDIDFGDISRGVESRTWTLPENGRIVSGGSGQTSSENVIKAKFNKAGIYNVVLNQKFKGNVFRNEDSSEPSDTRELDTTIVVTVLDSITSVLKVHRVNPDGSTGTELNLADNAEHELEASNFIRLSYTAIGEPQNINWSSEGGKPNKINHELTDDFVDMKFSKLGSWDLQYIADRFRPTDADTLFFEKLIKVIPSSAPVTLDRLEEKDNKILLEFSREIDDTTVNAGDFTVRIENNTDEMNPIVLNPTVTSATVDSNEATIVILELDNEPLYIDDQIYVSYTPGGLTTTDEVASDAIVDALVTEFTEPENIFALNGVDYGFESTTANSPEDGGGDWPYQNWGGNWGQYDIGTNFDLPFEGDKSMLINFRPNGGMIIAAQPEFTIEGGKTYEISYWLYLVDPISDAPTGDAASDIRFYDGPWSFADVVGTVFEPDMPAGEWIYQSATWQQGNTSQIKFLIRGQNANYNGPIKFYIDNMKLSQLNLRPQP